MGIRAKIWGVLGAIAMLCAGPVAARDLPPGVPSGIVEWGIYIDPDGCMHWWADGGFEGVMVPRLHPKTGKPMCLRRSTCHVGDADTYFETDSAALTPTARQNLERVFRQTGIFGYSVFGHTDSRASRAYNQALSERRAKSVAEFGRSLGVVIGHEVGFGEDRPVASNATPEGMRKNRRVEVICFQR